MLLPDVNVLIYAHREDERTHRPYRAWLERLAGGAEPFGLSVLVLVGFVRIVTNRKIYPEPTPIEVALGAVDQLVAAPGCRLLAPASDHYARVAALCRASKATGKLVADAQHAALAMAEGCKWVTRDGDFARFAPHGLSWEHLVLEANR